MLDGMLVGFVPVIPGSEDYDEPQVVAAIATTDYDAPVDGRASAPSPPPPHHFRRWTTRCPATVVCSADSSAASASSDRPETQGLAALALLLAGLLLGAQLVIDTRRSPR